ncbi:MAG: hypothetical protein U0V64_04955 [Cyclobacteriaceae bacterium]
MSSHHIVRENQEPALVVWDLVRYEDLAEFLEWSPLVIVTEQSMELVLSWGIRIDVVLGAHDGAFSGQEAPYFAPPGPDTVQTLIDLLSARQCDAVVVFGEESLLSTLQNAPWHIHISVVTTAWRWVRISADFHKWFPAGSVWRTFGRSMEPGEEVVSTRDGMIEFDAKSILWVGEKR